MSEQFELRILRTQHKEFVGRPEHMLIGGQNPCRIVNVDRLQYRHHEDDGWRDVPVVLETLKDE